MISYNNDSFRITNNKPGTVARAVARLLLVPLACAAMFVVGTSRTWAGTSSRPYMDSYVLQLLNNVNNPDGSQDQVYAGAGTNSVGGSFTIVIQVHIVQDPNIVCGVDSCAVVFHFAGPVVITVSNGDTLLSNLSGAEIGLLNLNFQPLPPPYALGGSQQITGGTGRFAGATGSLTFSGLDYRNNTVTISSVGTISTVGSTK